MKRVNNEKALEDPALFSTLIIIYRFFFSQILPDEMEVELRPWKYVRTRVKKSQNQRSPANVEKVNQLEQRVSPKCRDWV